MEFTRICLGKLTPEGALLSCTVCDAYRYFASDIVNDVTH